jgi:long-chain acyl-CoA synthetase
MSDKVELHYRLCVEGEDIFVCPLPLYHIYAFMTNMVLMASQGALNVLIPNPRDLDLFVKQIQGIPFTGISGINTLFVGLCSNPEFKALDFSHLRLTISGGTALIPEVAKTWKETTGCNIVEGYGLTEASTVLTLNVPGQEEIGTIGQALTNTIIEIRDEYGKNVPMGEAGELVAKGPQLMKGYWQREEATKETFTADGFLKTGDVAILQPNGNYRIVDRIKDMIIVSGFNVYPTEIESVLSTHPSVLEAAVVGRPSEKTGEEVVAYVTVSDSSCSSDELVKFCRDNLTGYKIPREINILDELPKSTVGKILRRELRDTK